MRHPVEPPRELDGWSQNASRVVPLYRWVIQWELLTGNSGYHFASFGDSESGASTMTHYKSNLRDLQFNLFEVFGADRAFGQAPFDEIDVETARDVLAEVNRLATEDLAASYEDADRNPPVFDPATHT